MYYFKTYKTILVIALDFLLDDISCPQLVARSPHATLDLTADHVWVKNEILLKKSRHNLKLCPQL